MSEVSIRGLVLFEKRGKENTLQLGSLHKTPPFDNKNNAGQQPGLASRRKIGGKLRPDSSDLRLRKERLKAQVPTGRPGSQFWREQIPLQNPCTLTPARAPRGTKATPGRELRTGTPRRESGAGGRFPRRSETSPGAKTRSWRGAGRGRASTRTFHARGQLPAQSGLCLGPLSLRPWETAAAPREGERARQGGEGWECQGPAGPQPGASQRADGGHLAPRCASRAIAGHGSRARAQGSAGPARAARRAQAEVTERRAPAAGSLSRTGCSMGGGAAGAGEGCSVAVRSGSRCPG